MCNLYSMTTNQEAIARLFKALNQRVGNLPTFPAIFPDNLAPVVRNAADGRELTRMRWGMPQPPQGFGPITNVRNNESAYSRRWLGPGNRCLVPWTSFSEYNDTANPKSLKDEDGNPHPMAGKKDVVWFSLDEDRPLAAFAGLHAMDRNARNEERPDLRQPYRLRIPDDRAERGCCARARQGNAGYIDD